MKLRILISATVITLAAALGLPIQCRAQEHNHKLPHYTVIDLGTLGGTFSQADGISNSHWVSGISTLPGDTEQHAFLWRDGVMIDLGTFGGPNSGTFFSPNERGDLGGQAETSTPDPLGENFCGASLICLPFLWHNGVMTPLPTLGGNNGSAQGPNNRGVVPGTAENTTQDPTCNPPQVLQIKPVFWEKGKIHELPTYPGDTIGVAHIINDMGQATGWSGICSSTTGFAGFHALLWQNGMAIYLGSLGGTLNTQGLGINNQGQVAGFGDLAGDTTFHAFLWQKRTGMIDLGTLSGDVASAADGLNNKGQVVGGSFASANARAFIWQDGVMTDLNTLIPPNSPLYLLEANGSINDSGQIAGYALQISTGEVHAFLATPRDGEDVGESAVTAPPEVPKVILPDNVRKLLERRAPMGVSKRGLVTPQ